MATKTNGFETWETQYEDGVSVVKYAQPESDAEAALRFLVIEDNGDRLLVDTIGASGFGCRQTLATFHFVSAND